MLHVDNVYNYEISKADLSCLDEFSTIFRHWHAFYVAPNDASTLGGYIQGALAHRSHYCSQIPKVHKVDAEARACRRPSCMTWSQWYAILFELSP
jgi:hypothetical protein